MTTPTPYLPPAIPAGFGVPATDARIVRDALADVSEAVMGRMESADVDGSDEQ